MKQPSSSIAAEMIAARIDKFGAPDVIKLETIATPTPGPAELLVKVKAAGVGPWDSWIRQGKSVLPQPLPLTLGSDFAGVIVDMDDNVAGFALGDRVFGATSARFTGAYAQYAVVDAAMIAKVPPSFDDVNAASVPVVAVTALQGLFDEAGVTEGEHVLIHGGAGNVGRYAVQMARAAGARVTATVYPQDMAEVAALGADNVIDVMAQRFEDHVQDVDAVLDLVGGETQDRSFQVLRRGGRLVSAVSEPHPMLAAAADVTAHFFLVSVTREKLDRIATLLEAGALETRIGVVMPLSAAIEAHRMLDGERPNPGGKIVLRID